MRSPVTPLRLLLVAFVLIPPRTNCAADGQPASEIFDTQIKTILISHCLECHGADAKAGLDLRSRDGLHAGGDSGTAMVPGEPEESLLYQYVAGGEMPPDDPLDEQQIAAIEAWIRGGGFFSEQPIDPFSVSTETRAGYDWWSLQPLRNVAPPDSPGIPATWRDNPIDRFVYARLHEAGLQPSPPADPVTLIRRATYDLTGLPPTPEQVDSFVRACRDETGSPGVVGELAYLTLVDSLLATPHYGEQWGRHWLDVVRFGESNGFERNIIHENVWPFRDYVIQSFNEDKPFKRLVVEHLAGDALGADDPEHAVGTAFLVCGPYDNVGNQDQAAAAQIRANTIDEMIRATSEAFLGMTVGCSRCHDHKFDPISQADYYGLYATLAGVRHGARRLRRPPPTAPTDQTDPSDHPSDTTNKTDPDRRPPVNPRQTVETFDAIDARFIRFTVTATNSGEPCIDELEIFTVAGGPGQSQRQNVGAAVAGAVATSSGDYAGNPKHKLTHINDGQYGNDHSWIADQNGAGWVQIELADVYTIDRIAWGRDRQGKFRDRLVTGYRIEVATEPGKWQQVASSEGREPFVDATEDDPETVNWWVGNFSQENGPFHVFIGGSPGRLGAAVTPASPSMLATAIAPYELPVDAPEQERRLALAGWIVSEDNPLTPRVLANRLWHYHFGTGIVATPSDFGFLGGRPSHPALLDYLAQQVLAGGWRLKPLHREIMRSQTYRQSSDFRRDAANVDGDSRRWWRFPPRRLSGEEIRDSMLAVAGQLNTRMDGPGFRLFRYVQDNVATYHPLDQHGRETYRRAVYHHRARAMQIDLMSEFDTPDCAFAAPRRTATTTPLQALTAMNHAFTVDMAAALAGRTAAEASSIEDQIRRAFLLAFSRIPADEEIKAAKQLIADHGTEAFCRALLNANEFIYID